MMKPKSPYFAAVDLGSNSFHMVIARVQDGRIEIVDREKEMIQLARGVDAEGRLTTAAQKRALACLARFAERLRAIPNDQVRAVGTKALRRAQHTKSFIKAAETALGVPIQVISGFEEARLVYTGLAYSVSDDHSLRLVIDIGGGSTELIIGKDFDPICLESISLGCVTYSERFFGDSGRISPARFEKAWLAACAELESIRKQYLKTGWKIAYGTSGTVKAIAELVQARDGGAVISAASLDWLAGEVQKSRSVLKNMPELRRSVLPAGIAILKAIFDQLKLDRMHVGDAALKEGLLYDSIGRLADHDSRVATVRNLQERYKVDEAHAGRVAQTALALWRQVDGPLLPRVSRTKILAWAAQLHEIGMSISHSAYHHHGYYILRNSDLAGFGRYEQYILANLVRAQRKGLYEGKFDEVDEHAMAALTPLIVCLRLAILLHRRREDIDVVPGLKAQGTDYRLKFPKKWLEAHPLTLAGLEQERKYLDAFGIRLDY
jgi:exopolyphosphatase/guanosine-5'-triphosphate,3'-diphosphate pyrophosphatase